VDPERERREGKRRNRIATLAVIALACLLGSARSGATCRKAEMQPPPGVKSCYIYPDALSRPLPDQTALAAATMMRSEPKAFADRLTADLQSVTATSICGCSPGASTSSRHASAAEPMPVSRRWTAERQYRLYQPAGPDPLFGLVADQAMADWRHQGHDRRHARQWRRLGGNGSYFGSLLIPKTGPVERDCPPQSGTDTMSATNS
jgi:hypothetical protein